MLARNLLLQGIVTCDKSVPSVVEQNRRLSKPFCLGYLPDVPSLFVHTCNWAFAAHGFSTTGTVRQYGGATTIRPLAVYVLRSEIGRGVCLKYALYKEEYIGVLDKVCATKKQEKRLMMDLTGLKDDAASVTTLPFSLLEQSSCVAIRHYIFITKWFCEY